MTRRAADDLLAELDSLGSEEQAAPTSKAAPKPAPKQASAKNEEEDDLFGELEKTLAAKPVSTSRPTTPRVSSSTTSGKAVTPASSSNPASERASEEKLRAGNAGEKGEGGVTPTEALQQKESITDAGSAGGGGWWGSMFSAASAAVKQAENLAKEIRGNEEAIKWAEQVKNYGAGLQSLSTISLHNTPHPPYQYYHHSSNCMNRYRPHLPRPPNLHNPNLAHRPSHQRPRTPPNPHHPRHRQLPLPGPPHLLRLLARNVASRRRRLTRNPTGL